MFNGKTIESICHSNQFQLYKYFVGFFSPSTKLLLQPSRKRFSLSLLFLYSRSFLIYQLKMFEGIATNIWVQVSEHYWKSFTMSMVEYCSNLIYIDRIKLWQSMWSKGKELIIQLLIFHLNSFVLNSFSLCQYDTKISITGFCVFPTK